MALSQILNPWKRLCTRKPRPITRPPAHTRLRIESLEDRVVPAIDTSTLFNQLGSRLTDVGSGLTSALNQAKTTLPIINQPLSSIASSVQNAISVMDYQILSLAKSLGLFSALNSGAATTAAQTIQSALSGVAQNVTVSDLNPAAGNVTVSMDLVKTFATSQAFNFGTGLPGIPFQINANGDVRLTGTFRYDHLTFGLAGGAFFVRTDQPDEVKLTLDAGLAAGHTTLTGTVGFLTVKATPINNGVGLHGQLVADVAGGGAGLQVAPPRFGGLTANADLHLLASFVPPAGLVLPGMNATEQAASLPKVQTDFHLGWDLSGSDPRSGLTGLGGAPDVALNNVQVGLGSFLSSAVSPIVSAVQRATAPLQPALDFLDARIPGLSDLGAGKVSLLTLAQAANDLGAVPLEFQPIVSLAVDLAHLLTLIQQTNIGANNEVWIDAGSYDLGQANGDLRALAKAGSVADLVKNPLGNLSGLQVVQAAAQNLRDQVNAKLSDSDPVQSALKSRLNDMLQQVDALSNGAHLSFPFFEDPLRGAVQILLGRDADLVSLDANFTVHTGDRELSKFPLWGPIEARLSGNLDLAAHFQAGYDTRGLREFLATGQAVKLADGLYLDSSRDLVNVQASVTASADYPFLPTVGPYMVGPVPVWVTAAVGIGGTLNGSFAARLHDPHRGEVSWDGKLRLFGEKLHELFDADGSLSAELDFHIDAYADDLVKLDTLYSKTLDSTVLFDSSRIDRANPFDPPSSSGYSFGGNPRIDQTLDMNKLPWGNDGQADTIEVLQNKDKYEAWVNGQLWSTYNVTDTRSLTITGSNDEDNVILHDLGLPVTVNGGAAVVRAPVPGLYTGRDSLTIDNRSPAPPSPDVYTLANGAVTRTSYYSSIPLSSAVTYGGVEEVRLILAPTLNRVSVTSLPTVPVTIQTSVTPYSNWYPWVRPGSPYESHNTITVSSAALGAGRQLNVVGSSADDQLVLQDVSGSGAVYSVTRDSVSYAYTTGLEVRRVSEQGTVHFNGLEDFDLVGQNVIDPQVTYVERLTGRTYYGLVGRTYRLESWTPDTALNITGGGGADTFFVGGGQIDPVSGGEIFDRMSVNLNGGGGSDALILNDSLNTDRAYQDPDGNVTQVWGTRPTYYVTDQLVRRDNVINGDWFNPVHLDVNYQNIKDLQVWGGGSSDTFRVISTAPGVTTTLSGDGGDDVADLGAGYFIGSGSVDPIRGPVAFDGGDGNDQLAVDDQENTQPALNGPYTVTDRGVQVRGFQASYTNAESVDLTLGQTGNYVGIPSTAAGAPVTVHTGQGDANVVIGTFGAFYTAQPDMSSLRSAVTVDGGGGSVNLTVGDVELTTGQSYVITDTTVGRADGPAVSYRGLKTLNVIGTRGADAFEVEGTAAGVRTNITGGFGSNVYNFGPSAHSLDGIQGPVSVQGSISPNDAEAVGFFDDQAADAHDYVVKTTGAFGNLFLGNTAELDRSGSAPITYQVQNGAVSLATGQGADTVNVRGVRAKSSLTLYAGAGDAVVLGSDPSGQGGDVQKILGSVIVLSSGGVASITVDDSADTAARSVQLTYSQDDSREYATLDGLAPGELVFGVGPETPIVVHSGSGDNQWTIVGPPNDVQVII